MTPGPTMGRLGVHRRGAGVALAALAIGVARPAAAADFGEDDAVAIDDTTTFPASAACRLELFDASGPVGYCSGTLIGPHHVLTAGHCVFQEEFGGWVEDIRVSPGYDRGARPFGAGWAIWIDAWDGWTDTESWLYDLAVLTLDRSLGDHAGWLPLAYEEDPDVHEGAIGEAYHYPGDPLGDTTIPFHSHDELVHADTFAIGHYLDIAPGSSGSGLLRSGEAGPELIGANTWHFSQWNNYATALNAERVAWLDEHIANDPVPPQRADLLSGECSLSFMVHEAGTPLDVEVTFHNWGTVDSGPLDVDVYFSADADVTHNDDRVTRLALEPLPPLSSRVEALAIDVPADVPTGDRYLGFIVDPDDTLEEIDETNQRDTCDGSIVVVPPEDEQSHDPDRTPPLDENDPLWMCRCAAAGGAPAGGGLAVAALAASLLGRRARRR